MSTWVNPFGSDGSLFNPLTFAPCKSALRPYESRKKRPFDESSGRGPMDEEDKEAAGDRVSPGA